MLLGSVRGDMFSNCRSSPSAPHLAGSFQVQGGFMSSPMNSPSTNCRTPITPQQTMMNYARMSYRYTTVRRTTTARLVSMERVLVCLDLSR
jgi:hypothetical protein